MEDNDTIEIRMGTFFMILGFGAFILFVMSDLADKADFDYLFAAMIMIALGAYFRRKKAPPPPSGRFAGIKSLSQKMKERKGADKKEGKEKK